MLEGLAPVQKVFACRVRTFYRTLDPADQQIFFAALTNLAGFSHKGLERALAQRGISISESSLRKHRLGDCSCALGWEDA